MPLSKTDRKRHDAALSSINKYYSSPTLWGPRWSTSLYPSLLAPKPSTALLNPFHPSLSSLLPLSIVEGPWSSAPVPLTLVSDPPPPGATHYILDAASLIPPLLLAAPQGGTVLDLCAAPGGKTLVLATQVLFSSNGSITALDVDAGRAARLRRVVGEYLPPSVAGRVRVERWDGLKGVPRGGYDAVLLDAPCSSERHVLSAGAKAERAGRVSSEVLGLRMGTAGKRDVVRTQVGLLMVAIKAVREGGRVVYSTCSVDRVENEGVVKTVAEKCRKEGIEVEVLDAKTLLEGVEEISEECEVGRICLPDQGRGWGPIYFCALERVPK